MTDQEEKPELSAETKAQALNEKLVQASRNLNLVLIKELLSQGADINYVARTDSGSWYVGNSHTALSAAVQANFTDENAYINVIQYLLEQGADMSFKMLRGSWNRASQYSIVSKLPYQINRFQNDESKIQLIKILIKYGLNVNQGDFIHNEYRNGYSQYSFTFGTKLIELCGLKSRISQLQKIYSFNSYQIKEKREKEMKKLFDNLYPQQEDQMSKSMTNSLNNLRNLREQTKLNLSLIEKLIDIGVCPNSCRSENTISGGSRWTFQCYKRQQKQTIFHRAIMNNELQLVKKMIEKGADSNQFCTITVSKPIYPFEWSEDLKQFKMNEYKDRIKDYEERKYEQQKQLKKQMKNENIQNIKDYKQKIRQLKYQIFKAQRFELENEVPITEHKPKSLSCLEIAQALNISFQIIELIKNHQNKVN